MLEVRVSKLDLDPALTAVCAGFEQGDWRSKQLAEHMVEWILDFVLTHAEKNELDTGNAVRKIREAAHQIYSTENAETRGELGHPGKSSPQAAGCGLSRSRGAVWPSGRDPEYV